MIVGHSGLQYHYTRFFLYLNPLSVVLVWIQMVQQSHKEHKLSDLSDEMLNKVANEFEELPIQLLNFHAATHIDQVGVCYVMQSVLLFWYFIHGVI